MFLFIFNKTFDLFILFETIKIILRLRRSRRKNNNNRTSWTASSEFGTYSLCEQRRFRAVSPEPSLLAHTNSESRGTFTQKARSLAPLNGWACAVKVCHDGMLEDTNSLDAAQFIFFLHSYFICDSLIIIVRLFQVRRDVTLLHSCRTDPNT